MYLLVFPESPNQVMRTFLRSGNLACSRVEEANGVKLTIHEEEEIVATLFKGLLLWCKVCYLLISLLKCEPIIGLACLNFQWVWRRKWVQAKQWWTRKVQATQAFIHKPCNLRDSMVQHEHVFANRPLQITLCIFFKKLNYFSNVIFPLVLLLHKLDPCGRGGSVQ